MAHTDKVLSFGDYVVREADLDILKGYSWLNDTLIGFYFEYLSNYSKSSSSKGHNEDTNLAGDNPESARNVCYFVGPEVTQLVKLISSEDVPEVLKAVLEGIDAHEYTAFAVNDSNSPSAHSGGTHWSLLIYSKVDSRFVHFDSMNQWNDKDAKIIVNKLSQHTNNAVFVNNLSCKVQANSHDCGCHVLRNAELILQHVTSNNGASLLPSSCPSATPQEAAEMRPELLSLIQKLVQSQSNSP